MSESPEYDASALEQLANSIGQEGVAEVVRVLISDAPNLVGGLRESLEKEDSRGMKRHSHTLKSACGIVGARKLSALCGELEEFAASAAPLVGVRPQATAAAERYERLARDLGAWLQAG